MKIAPLGFTQTRYIKLFWRFWIADKCDDVGHGWVRIFGRLLLRTQPFPEGHKIEWNI